MYKKAHSSIRADPAFSKKPEAKKTKKRWTALKLTLAQRKEKVAKKKADFMAKLEAEAEA
jgi:large subunit ribosomal protein L5e